MSQAPHAWEGSYPARADWRTPVTAGHVCELLDEAVAAHPDRVHLEFEGHRITYAESARHVAAITALLAAHGIGRGQVVAFLCANSPWHILAFFAAQRLGAIVAHLTPLDAPRELRFKLQDTGARTLVTLAAEPLIASALQLADGGLLDRIFVGDDGVWTMARGGLPADPRIIDLAAPLPPPSRPVTTCGAPSDVALIQYTGGTTGVPKGAMLTHANLTSAVSQFNRWMSAEPYWNPAGERHLMVLPGFHIYALVAILLRATGRGDTIHVRTRFDAGLALADLEAHRISWFFAVPTMLVAMAAHPDIESRDLGALAFCVAGGAPLPTEVAARFRRLTGLPVGVGWGMTETAGAGTMTPASADAKPGCVGLPLPNVSLEVVDMDDPHKRIGSGRIGELRIRGPNVFAGYWRRPEETAATFAEGFLLTGDVGFIDDDGFVFLVDRKKDLIISGGFNVYPRVVEEAIYEHPAVEEVLVYAVPDAYRGEAAKAAIKLRAGHAPFSLDDLRAFLADKVGRHELPAALAFHDALPRTAVGKLSRKDLAAAERP